MSEVAVQIGLFVLGLVFFVGFIIWFGKFTGLTNLVKDLAPGGTLSKALQFAEVAYGSKFAWDMAAKSGFRVPFGKFTMSNLKEMAGLSKTATGATKEALEADSASIASEMAKTKQGAIKLGSAEGKSILKANPNVAEATKAAEATPAGEAAAAAAAEAEEAEEIAKGLSKM